MQFVFSQTDFRKNLQLSNFVKNRPVAAELFHADEQTDMTKLIVAFRNFANSRLKIRWTGHGRPNVLTKFR